MNNYTVGQFSNHKTGEFSLTSRKVDCKHFASMIVKEQERGFDFQHLVFVKDKASADVFKANVQSNLLLAGYVKSPRSEHTSEFEKRVKLENRVDEVSAKKDEARRTHNLA